MISGHYSHTELQITKRRVADVLDSDDILTPGFTHCLKPVIDIYFLLLEIL